MFHPSLVLTSCCILLLIAVVSSNAEPTYESTHGPCLHMYSQVPQRNQTVKFISRDWSTHHVTREVLQIIMEEILGYATETVLSNFAEVKDRLDKGLVDIDPENWFMESDTSEYALYVTQRRTMEVMGLLGYGGQEGLFIPNYTLARLGNEYADYYKYYQPSPGSDNSCNSPDWDDFVRINEVNMTNKDECPHSWCNNSHLDLNTNSAHVPPVCQSNPQACLVLLGSTSTWGTATFESLVRNHNMCIITAFMGTSFDADDSEIRRFYAKGRDMVLSNWEPNDIHYKISLVRLSFPQPRLECDVHTWKIDSPRKCDDKEKAIQKVVSTKLRRENPKALAVIEKFQIKRSELDFMMRLRQVGDCNDRCVACTWLKSLPPEWFQKTIPPCVVDQASPLHRSGLFFKEEDLSCQVQLGKDNCTDGTIFLASLNKCVCAPGFYMESDECNACEGGRFADAPGLKSCTSCQPGMYSIKQSSACTFCGIGRYAERAGQDSCTNCPANLVTEFPGSTEPALCNCPAGTYYPAPPYSSNGTIRKDQTGWAYYFPVNANSTSCSTCPWGMQCSGRFYPNSSLVGWHSQPITLKQFFATDETPYSAFACKEANWCPGRRSPGLTCAANRKGFVCGKCEKKHYAVKDGSCKECTGGDSSLILIGGFLILLAMPFVVYFSYDVRITHSNQTPKHVALSSGHILVYFLEACAIIGDMNIRWPYPVKEMLSAVKIFSFDLSHLKPACLFSGSYGFEQKYTLSGVLPLMLGAILAAALLLSTIFAKLMGKVNSTITRERSICTFGIIYVSLYVAVCRSVLRVFECYKINLLGRRQLAAFPYVECLSDQWWSMMPLGITFFLTYGVATFALSIWLNKAAVRMFKQKNVFFVKSFGFLFHEFRRDCWWWLPIVMLRNLLLPLALVIAPGDGQAQSAILFCINLAYTVGMLCYWPWLTWEVNVLDACSMGVGLLMLLALSSSFQDPSVGATNQSIYAALMSTSLIGSFVLISGSWGGNFTKHMLTRFGLIDTSKAQRRWGQKVSDTKLCEILKETCTDLVTMTIRDLEKITSHMNTFDHSVLCRFLSLAKFEVLKRTEQVEGLPMRVAVTNSLRKMLEKSHTTNSLAEIEEAYAVADPVSNGDAAENGHQHPFEEKAIDVMGTTVSIDEDTTISVPPLDKVVDFGTIKPQAAKQIPEVNIPPNPHEEAEQPSDKVWPSRPALKLCTQL